MKQKQMLRTAYSAGILALLLIPAVMTAVQQAKNSPQADTDNAENRVLSEFPSIKGDDGAWNSAYFGELEQWFSEHFGLRSEMVTAYGSITRGVFGVSAEPDVIIGRDGWLYYTETVPDITGVRTLSDAEIAHMAHNLELMSAYAEAHGASLILAVAPDKGSIYPDYLPLRYLHTGGENNLDALYRALADSAVTVCDWRGALQAQADTRLLYHKLDTHWNGDGAMLGYKTLLQTAGLDASRFAGAARTETQDWTGDLWTMLSPAKENPDANAVYDIPQTWQSVGRMRSVDDMTIRTTCTEGSGSLLMFRDSFGRALLPLLSQSFASCTYSRAEAVPLDRLETVQTDVVVYERVERELTDLLVHAPQMPAPECDITPPPRDFIPPLRLETEQAGSYLHCYGLFEEQFSGCEAVYVTVGGQSYEAFLCCEQALLELDTHTANGFSLYLPADSIPQSGTATVTVRQNGKLYNVGMAEYAQ